MREEGHFARQNLKADKFIHVLLQGILNLYRILMSIAGFNSFHMRHFTFTIILSVVLNVYSSAQSLYFPPLTGNQWATTPLSALSWCPDSVAALIDYVGNNNSKAFLILKDGKIVVENYYGTFTQDSLWYWASAGKSLTAFLVGLAQEDGLLNIDSASSLYQGAGWTACPPQEEAIITVKNQLCMTSGLDTDIPNLDCTDPACLNCAYEPGSRWYYHNAPYTQLDAVISGAAGSTLNNYYLTRLRNRIGMNGAYVPLGYNNVKFSSARSFARFGLLVLNRGIWAADTVMQDSNYFDAMVNTSQDLNKSYGYLWWLNGKESFRLPETELVFPGYLMPDAPADLIAAVGKNSQLLLIVPSQNLIVVRMGDEPPGINGLVPTALGNEIMERIGRFNCQTTGISNLKKTQENVKNIVLKNGDCLQPESGRKTLIYNASGQNVLQLQSNEKLCSDMLDPGLYFWIHDLNEMPVRIWRVEE
jgi:CubicO group peptidase (beta-lactamase class C family)